MEKREPIHAWMEREKGIPVAEWNAMVERAADQYLREHAPMNQIAKTFSELEAQDPISADELGGSIERILGKALGWKSYVRA